MWLPRSIRRVRNFFKDIAKMQTGMMALQTNVADLTEKVNAIVILVPGLVANNAALQKQLGSADLDADVQAQADLVAKDVAALAALVTPAAPAAPEAPQTQPE